MFAGLNVALGLGSSPQHLPAEMAIVALLEDAADDAAGLFLNHFLSMYLKCKKREGERGERGMKTSLFYGFFLSFSQPVACSVLYFSLTKGRRQSETAELSEREKRDNETSYTLFLTVLPNVAAGQRVVLISLVQLQNHYNLALRRLVSEFTEKQR